MKSNLIAITCNMKLTTLNNMQNPVEITQVELKRVLYKSGREIVEAFELIICVYGFC